MKKFLFLVSILFAFLFTQAQDSLKSTYKHAFGLDAGFTSGLGFSYRFFPGKFGFQLNCLPLYKDYGKNIWCSTGLSLLYRLGSYKKVNFNLYLGNHLIYKVETISEYHESEGSSRDYWYEDKREETYTLNTGIGINMELNPNDRFVWNFAFGLAQMNNLEVICPSLEIGLHFRF